MGRYSRHAAGGTDGDVEASSEHHSNTRAASDVASRQTPTEADNGPASAIQQALRNGQTQWNINKAWEILEQNYTSRECKAFREPSLTDATLLSKGKVFQDLLEAVNGAVCRARVKPAVTPTMVLLKYERLGIAPPEYWTRVTLSYLTLQAIMAVNASSMQSTRNLPSILSELSSVWRLFFQCKGLRRMPIESISTEWNIPTTDALPEIFTTRDFNMRLQEFHPRHAGNPTLGFCAVYFYTISDALRAIAPLHKEAAPFLHFLGRMLAGSHVDSVLKETHVSYRFRALPEEIQKEIVNEINNAPIRAMSELGASGETLTESESGDPAANLEAFHLKRIVRAVESKASARSLNNLWQEVVLAFTQDNKCAIPPRIYNAFLSGYLIHLQAQRSVDTWNHMIAHGIKPDIQSWVALLEGCEKAKDLNGLNSTWARMLSTGTEPDNHAWTTRIHGLFSLRQVDLGLAALDDMGKRWLASETAVTNSQTTSRQHKGTKNTPSTAKINTRVKPSIEVINGAITALIQLPNRAMYHEKRVQLVQKILAWAGNFQIKPDAVTFNSLIQLYLRAGDSGTAFKILRQMEQDGIPADIATHTMLISFSFENKSFDNLSEVQQTEKIIDLLDSIEASGVKLNAYIYGTAIDRLLKQYSNHNAVRVIIEHMHERKMVPSAHVYTSLVTFYFQQEPPAIGAVNSLVDQFFTSHRIMTDRVLFDRTIEGYAAHGEVGRMMSVLTRMSKQGGLPGWSALTAVVEALVRDGDMDRARAVVREVEHGRGVAQGGIMGTAQAESKFFAVVRAHGVGLENERMGDVMSDTQLGVRGAASGEHRDEASLQHEHPNPQQQQDLVGAQHDGTMDSEAAAPPSQQVPSEAYPTGAQYEQAPRHAESQHEAYERGPRMAPVEDDEDVHGFLSDEHEDIHSSVHKP